MQLSDQLRKQGRSYKNNKGRGDKNMLYIQHEFSPSRRQEEMRNEKQKSAQPTQSKNNALYHRHVNMTEGKKHRAPLLVKQVAL